MKEILSYEHCLILIRLMLIMFENEKNAHQEVTGQQDMQSSETAVTKQLRLMFFS